MAVILDPKPRVRLPAGDFPEPKLVRSRSWLPYLTLLWICAVVVGHGILYRWLPLMAAKAGPVSDNPATVGSEYEALAVRAVSGAGASAPARLQASAPLGQSLPPARQTAPARPALDLDKLPACDAVNADEMDESSGSGRLLPVDLSRTALGTLLDFPRWTGPCRARRAARVHLCLAIRNGNILAATARADPRDASLERCVIRAASLVHLEPEDALRKVQLDVEIAAERLR